MGARGKRRVRGPAPIWKLVVTDFVLLAVALNVFALFHHVLPSRGRAVGTVSARATASPEAQIDAIASAAAVEATPQPQATQQLPAEEGDVPAETAEPPESHATAGDFSEKFAALFTSGEVNVTDHSYESPNLNIHIGVQEFENSRCYIADIYIRDISCIQTVFAKDTYGRGFREWPTSMAARTNSVLMINGDYYGTHDTGIVVRNGVLYRDDPNTEWDVGVLYWDGTMETFSPGDFDANREMERGACQVWNFGPMLLDANGEAMTEFNSNVNPRNPRTAIGYFEPGHYCFVVVDGRSNTSRGLEMAALSTLMYQIGCTRAYNLDGGESSQMVAMTEVVNDPYKDGRKVSDAVFIREP